MSNEIKRVAEGSEVNDYGVGVFVAQLQALIDHAKLPTYNPETQLVIGRAELVLAVQDAVASWDGENPKTLGLAVLAVIDAAP